MTKPAGVPHSYTTPLTPNPENVVSPNPAATPKDRAIAWFARMRSRRYDRHELQAFEEWLRADETHRSEYQAVERVWDDLGELTVPDAWHDECRRYAKEGKKPAFPGPWAMAAGLAFGVFAVFLFLRGETYRTDGEPTTVFVNNVAIQLNAHSQLEVVEKGDQNKTRLRQGEAFFSVEHGKTPFLVVAGAAEIRDLGTKFLVRKTADRVDIAVFDGLVSVASVNGSPRTLAPGEFLSISESGATDINPLPTISETGEEIVLTETPLHEFVFYLKTHHHFSIDLDERVAFTPVSGVFGKNNVNAIIEALPRILPVAVQENTDGKILIRKTS